MSNFKNDDEIEQLVMALLNDEIETPDELYEVTDAYLSYDESIRGGDIMDLFMHGFDVAKKAGNNDVYEVSGRDDTFLFIGPREDIITRLKMIQPTAKGIKAMDDISKHLGPEESHIVNISRFIN
jgi:hypothetical protein